MQDVTASSEKEVAAFFYGSFIRMDVLGRVGFKPERFEVARLSGFDIHISPHAALSRSNEHSIYGILVKITHDKLRQLYSMDGVGVFLPEAVLVQTMDGKMEPALCYIPPAPGNQAADGEYLDKLIEAGRSYGFPAWYLKKLEGLR